MARRRPYKRTDRLGEQIKQVVAVALQRETHESCLHQLVVTDVQLTRDLSVARVFYYPMSGDIDEIKTSLARASGFLRSRVGQQIRARHTPELRFELDEVVDSSRRVMDILGTIELPEEE